MSSTSRTSRRRALTACATAVVLTALLAACGPGGAAHDSAGTHHDPAASAPASAADPSGHPAAGAADGMADMPGPDGGTGLTDTVQGYRLTAPDTPLPAGAAADYRFTVTGPDGRAVTDFAVDQTQRMHFYAVRSDLTGFQHLHPTMAADGTWTASLAALAPGTWRTYASFVPKSGGAAGSALVLSRPVTVPGTAAAVPLPPAATTAQVDGYTVTVRGEPMARMAHPMTVHIARDGGPVTDLQPYLDTYAHLTAVHAGDLAFAHLHPATAVDGDHGGPDLTFHAEFPQAGDWRLFLQFRAGGRLHTAELTLRVG
ncbi:hypothetical protein [Kitasatospora paranensis]|uniref:Secreted protein n=1 Tax=Kitasatospora paranensis TaxID=258053 RepID=A0ABW2FW26_9ACTN